MAARVCADTLETPAPSAPFSVANANFDCGPQFDAAFRGLKGIYDLLTGKG